MAAAVEKTATVLFIDDDAQHLKLYKWIIERGPFSVVPVLAGGGKFPDLPGDAPDVVALDYRLKGSFTAAEIAQELTLRYPQTPVLVLSDMEWLPDDVAPYSAAFLRKGQPEKLLEVLAELAGGRSANQ
jgi:DNA-binding NarL/FixJ family response regulator